MLKSHTMDRVYDHTVPLDDTLPSQWTCIHCPATINNFYVFNSLSLNTNTDWLLHHCLAATYHSLQQGLCYTINFFETHAQNKGCQEFCLDFRRDSMMSVLSLVAWLSLCSLPPRSIYGWCSQLSQSSSNVHSNRMRDWKINLIIERWGRSQNGLALK